MWNFKGILWNSTQNILPIHWKIWFLHNTEFLRARRCKSSYAFFKRPQTHIVNKMPCQKILVSQGHMSRKLSHFTDHLAVSSTTWWGQIIKQISKFWRYWPFVKEIRHWAHASRRANNTESVSILGSHHVLELYLYECVYFWVIKLRYSGVNSDFVIDCLCGVWCRKLTLMQSIGAAHPSS